MNSILSGTWRTTQAVTAKLLLKFSAHPTPLLACWVAIVILYIAEAV